ncbi:4-hydroxybenzoate octaprenyltransferase [invertebrate metagenome]|uniref:4-hydroxybenzoate octaprenyltransferase n=1 Tax=invertebrate metagenome TaxID=1711999 RepID=A0A2H9T4D3_9ZZZZ
MASAFHLSRIKDFVQLARLDKPIGIYLLLWPTLGALWLAAHGKPSLHNIIVFIAGVILMRSAGCVINDYADRHFDGRVKRTRNRPLVTGKVTDKEALLFFTLLLLCSFLLVLTTNWLTVQLSCIGLILASAYPFAKRVTHLPQLILGITFSWAIPMAYTAETNSIDLSSSLLFIANLFWIIAYDTQYAMVDRNDDVKIGIRSTAILFGRNDNIIIVILQVLSLSLLSLMGVYLHANPLFFVALFIAGILFIYQHTLTRKRQRTQCFKAFLSNHWVGAVIFLGIIFI